MSAQPAVRRCGERSEPQDEQELQARGPLGKIQLKIQIKASGASHFAKLVFRRIVFLIYCKNCIFDEPLI